MTGISLGGTAFSKLAIGSTPIQKVSLGSSLLWSAGNTFTDDFNRADAATLGANWRVDVNSQPKIASNRAQFKTPSNGNGRAGNWVSYSAGTLNSDNYSVKLQLIAPSGNLATDNYTGAVLAVGDTFGSGVMCMAVVSTGSGIGIVTQSGTPPTTGVSSGGTGQTVQATNATTVATTDLVEFQRVGNVFTLYKNGVSVLSWTDASNIVSKGSAYRRFGMIVEGNYPLFNAAYYSPAVDSIIGADL